MTILDKKLAASLFTSSRDSTRLRAHHCLHANPDDPVQRVVIAMQPGSYCRPHRHITPHADEYLVVIRGRIAILVFDDDGKVVERHEPGSEGPLYAVDIQAGSLHTVVALKPDTLILETRAGPYQESNDKTFPDWSVPEDSPDARSVEQWMRSAQPGTYQPCPS